MLKVVYAFFVGILLSIFVGIGISTFYPAPTPPESPAIYQRSDIKADDPEFKRQEAEFTAAQKQYNQDSSTYNRNVSIISLIAAVVFLSGGLLLASRIHILSDGLVLGGVFTLVYSLGRGFMTDENTYRFVVVTIGLLVVLALGYLKFIKPTKTTTKKR